MSSELDGELSSFMGEAEELVAGLYEILARIDPATKPRQSDINAMFRSTHTFKGLAGMLGFNSLQSLAHGLEDLLGELRLDHRPWSENLFEIIAQGIDHLREIVQGIGATGLDQVDLSTYLRTLSHAAQTSEAEAPRLDIDLPDAVRATLTEYEESRLASCQRESIHLHEVTFRIKLAEFAAVGKEISDALEATGEIITKLPAPGMSGGAELVFLYLVATSDPGFADALPDIFGERLVACRELTARIVGAGAKAPETAGTGVAADEPATLEEGGEESPTVGRGQTGGASVRIELETLDSLTALVGGLLAEKAHLEEIARRYRESVGDDAPYPELLRSIRDIERRVVELQRGLMTVRLVPIGQIWSRLRRIVQGYSRATGKRISLTLDGGDTKLDKVIVEKLADPLIHIIRNAIDHGIESASEREEMGKPPQGLVQVRAVPRGSQILVIVKDDGHGIDWGRVRAKGIESGLLRKVDDQSERELAEVLFQPGFSTAATVTDMSGRGVGLDVVRRNLADVKGFIDVRSARHEGTEFTVTLPITLAIFQSLIIEAAGRMFAIPLSSVVENLRLEAGEVQSIEGRRMIRHRGVELAVMDLGQAMLLRDRPPDGGRFRYFVVVGSAERRLALQVDAIRGQREIVTKPLGRLLSDVPGLAGGALVGESQMAMVLDIGALLAA